MGDYAVGRDKGKYPGILASQNTQREISLKLKEYKQAVADYDAAARAAVPDAKSQCPADTPFPFQNATLTGPGTKASGCCADGMIKKSGRWPTKPGADVAVTSIDRGRIPGSLTTALKVEQNASSEECAEKCLDMKACKGVVTIGSSCALVGDMGNMEEYPLGDSLHISDDRPCGGHGGGRFASDTDTLHKTNIVGSIIRTAPAGTSREDCNLLCTNDPSCVAFTVNANGVCTLKNSAEKLAGADPAHPEPIDDGGDPKTWGGTCQGFADRFGASGSMHGCAGQEAVDWYERKGCASNNLSPGQGTSPVACGAPTPDMASDITGLEAKVKHPGPCGICTAKPDHVWCTVDNQCVDLGNAASVQASGCRGVAGYMTAQGNCVGSATGASYANPPAGSPAAQDPSAPVCGMPACPSSSADASAHLDSAEGGCPVTHPYGSTKVYGSGDKQLCCQLPWEEGACGGSSDENAARAQALLVNGVGCPKGSTPASPDDQSTWNDCQAMADYYGIVAGRAFGCSPKGAQDAWARLKCNTSASNPASAPGCSAPGSWPKDCKSLANYYNIIPGQSFGCAPADAQEWWVSQSCATPADPGSTAPGCANNGRKQQCCTGGDWSSGRCTGQPTDSGDPEPEVTSQTVCQYLAAQFGMRPTGSETAFDLGCATGAGKENPAAQAAINAWQANSCTTSSDPTVVKLANNSDYPGCNPDKSPMRVDTFLLSSPKPCFDSKGHATGITDWCVEGSIKTCEKPPCLPNGDMCPISHPYPVHANGVEDGACCDTPPEKAERLNLDPLPKLPLDTSNLQRQVGKLRGMVSQIWGGAGVAAPEPTSTAGRPVSRIRAQGKPESVQVGTSPMGLGMQPQVSGLFEGFQGGKGKPQCKGSTVKCANPPCRSGTGEVAAQRAWKKVEKMNAELMDLVSKAGEETKALSSKGSQNTTKTKGNNARLKELEAELKREKADLAEMAKEFRLVGEHAPGENLVIGVERWHWWWYCLVLVVCIVVAVRVLRHGTAGTAELVAAIAAIILIVHQSWGGISEAARSAGRWLLGWMNKEDFDFL